MNMTWERLILLSLSKKGPKNYGSAYGSDAYVSSSIKVINCNNEYFVYYLIDTPHGFNGGYCTESQGGPFFNHPCFDFT